MAVFHHVIVIDGFSRDWFEEFVREFADGVEALRFEDGELVTESATGGRVVLIAGRHIGPGTQYRLIPDAEGVPPTSVTVTRWDRDSEISIGFSKRSNGMVTASTRTLRSVTHPRTAQLHGTYNNTSGPWLLRQASWSLDLDLERWWAHVSDASSTPGPAPMTFTFVHPHVTTTLEIVPSPAGSNRWSLKTTATIRSTSWARPVVAVALLLGRKFLDSSYREMIHEIVPEWNAAVERLRDMPPQKAAAQSLGAFWTENPTLG
jgi:hypothetical protein